MRKPRRERMKQPSNPTFTYTSRCCEAATKKDTCERSVEDRREGKFSESGLGKWRCMACKHKCIVRRSKNEVGANATVKNQ